MIVPSQFSSLKLTIGLQFLWKSTQAVSTWHYLTVPLSLPATFLSDPYATKLLAVSSVVMAAIQFGMTKFTQQQGMKLI